MSTFQFICNSYNNAYHERCNICSYLEIYSWIFLIGSSNYNTFDMTITIKKTHIYSLKLASY